MYERIYSGNRNLFSTYKFIMKRKYKYFGNVLLLDLLKVRKNLK